jgi:hypothetical protein
MVRVGHNGIVPGHTANIEFIPALKLGVIVCTNSNEGDPTAFVDYALQLLSPIVAKSVAGPPPKPDQQWKRYEGIYRSKDYRTWVATILDGQLSLVPPDAPNPATARTVLEATSDPTAFTMRVGLGNAQPETGKNSPSIFHRTVPSPVFIPKIGGSLAQAGSKHHRPWSSDGQTGSNRIR